VIFAEKWAWTVSCPNEESWFMVAPGEGKVHLTPFVRSLTL
jgi:hypothetical protein